jgi:hypothetical protein
MESRLDQIYRSVILTKFFTKGWGHPNTLQQILRHIITALNAKGHKVWTNLSTCKAATLPQGRYASNMLEANLAIC